MTEDEETEVGRTSDSPYQVKLPGFVTKTWRCAQAR